MSLKQHSIDWNYLFISVLAALFFLPFLGGVHLFDWDEINFAECSREMIVSGDYLRPQINFQPFWEKPPLFIWFQAVSMHIFGVNEYAARFPNAICGITTLLLLYHFGKELYNKTFGWLWVGAYCGSILPHLYFKSGIIDPFFNLFIFLALIFLIKSNKNQATQYLPLFVGGVFAGLAILTKGPVGLLIIGLTWFIKHLIYKELSIKLIINFTIFSITALFVTSLWFGIETLKNGFWFVNTFIEYNIRLAQTEDAGHGGFVGYHFVVLLFGCFPASIFALQSLLSKQTIENENKDFTRWMKTLFWVVLILFSLVQSKIVHYSSMCYLPLTFLSALALKRFIDANKLPHYIRISLLIVGLLIGCIFTIIPFIGQNITVLKPLLQKDIFALKNLEAAVYWTGFEAFAGIFFMISLVFVYFMLKKRDILRGSFALFLSTAVFVNAVLILFINNIEGYSQNAAIEFYKNKSQEDCLIETSGFKSYAHLFYAKKRLPTPSKSANNEGQIGNKPTYLVAKYSSKEELDALPNLQFLYQKNGFLFYLKK